MYGAGAVADHGSARDGLVRGGAYAELKVGVHAVNRAWATDDQIQLTVLSFDGTRLKGTFVGQLEQAGEQNPNDPPAPVEKGKISVDLLGG